MKGFSSVFLFSLVQITTLIGSSPAIINVLDWIGFLGRQDLVWNTLPENWIEAPFLGNGMLGIQLYQTGEHTLRLDIGRGDVQDHRLPVQGRMNDRCRLPIGYFELHTEGILTGANLTLNLAEATLSGSVKTDRGPITLSAYVHAEQMAIVVKTDNAGNGNQCRWEWHSLPAVSPRWTRNQKHYLEDYPPNPPSDTIRKGDMEICIQPLHVGGETATAWKQQLTPEGYRELIISVEHSFPEPTARYEVYEHVRRAADTSSEARHDSHLRWWRNFYKTSFISIPDPYWEAFYWIQMYKLASATREDRMLLDNQGPWLQPTSWPGAWWNLNVQLSYWPMLTSNRHRLAYSLPRTLKNNVEALIMTVPEPYRYDSAALGRETGQHLWGQEITEPGSKRPETGHLTWALHNVWLIYRHTMDETLLRDTLYPLLRRAVNYYLHFLEEDDAGVLHLPQTWSPEYHGIGPDCNYDLALLRWGCKTLIRSTQILDIVDPLLPVWTDTLERLAEFPVNANGLMIAAGVALEYGHRHYSHLLAFYPLYLLNKDMPGAEQLMERSLHHWFSLEGMGEEQFAGYSFTGAASIAASFGRGDEAFGYLNRLKTRIFPNTLYGETESPVPVLETPLSAAQSIHDMLLQSWGGTIRVFPAMPDAWPEAVFHNLSAEGGFLVSARREDNKTQWIRVESRAGEPVEILPNLPGEPQVDPAHRDRIISTEIPGRYILKLPVGEEIILWSGEQPAEFILSPVKGEGVYKPPPFGLP